MKKTLATTIAAAALALVAPQAAQAAPIGITYDVTGSTTVASTGSTIPLGPSTLATQLDLATGTLTGSMPLPGATTRFEVIGFIPVTADVNLVEAAPITGSISNSGYNIVINSTASYHIRLSNIRVVGFPLFAGPSCRTKNPVTIPANTPAGQSFNLFGGGNLAGTFSIGDFQNCGLNTWLINLLIPGSGNTANIVASNGRLS
jgi:hypothetical protein